MKIFLTGGFGPDTGNRTINRGLALFLANVLEFSWKTFILKHNPPITKSMVYLMETEFSINDSKAREILGYHNVITTDEGMKALKAS